MQSTTFDRRAHPPGATFETWRAGDGFPIRRMDWPQPPGQPANGSILFCGGRGDFIEKYLEPLAHWHARGWDVTSFDWRSQGESRGDIEGGHLDSFDPLLADGSAFLKDWMGRTPAPHVGVGHSMGGHLLLRILADERPPLAASVLVAPMIGINSLPLPSSFSHAMAQTFCMIGLNRTPAWRQSLKPASEGSTRQSFLTSCRERYSDELWWLERQPDYALGAPSWGWLNAAYSSMAKLTEEKLRSVETPVLLLGAERDRLVSASAIRWAAGLLPKAEIVMYPDAAHEILREAEPLRSEVMARIDDFLARAAA
jgi:lysophospholipase